MFFFSASGIGAPFKSTALLPRCRLPRDSDSSKTTRHKNNKAQKTALFIQDIADITYSCSDCTKLENSRLESQTCHAAMPALNGATVKTKKCCVTIIPCHAYRTGSVLFWPLASRPATAEAELE